MKGLAALRPLSPLAPPGCCSIRSCGGPHWTGMRLPTCCWRWRTWGWTPMSGGLGGFAGLIVWVGRRHCQQLTMRCSCVQRGGQTAGGWRVAGTNYIMGRSRALAAARPAGCPQLSSAPSRQPPALLTPALKTQPSQLPPAAGCCWTTWTTLRWRCWRPLRRATGSASCPGWPSGWGSGQGRPRSTCG